MKTGSTEEGSSKRALRRPHKRPHKKPRKRTHKKPHKRPLKRPRKRPRKRPNKRLLRILHKRPHRKARKKTKPIMLMLTPKARIKIKNKMTRKAIPTMKKSGATFHFTSRSKAQETT